MSVEPTPSAEVLDQLQLQMVREQVRRARAMTAADRIAEAFSLTNTTFHLMLDGAMHRLGTTDRQRGWCEVRDQLNRLRRSRDAKRFSSSRPCVP